MKRLIRAYLTLLAILIFLANAVLIVLYGRQLHVFGCIDGQPIVRTGENTCNASSPGLQVSELLIVNLVVIAIGLLFWFVIRLLIHEFSSRRSHREPPNHMVG